jgi:hypothetical protein
MLAADAAEEDCTGAETLRCGGAARGGMFSLSELSSGCGREERARCTLHSRGE